MVKKLKSSNLLIKRKQLIKILKTKGIKRFNKKALEKLGLELEKKVKDYAKLLSRKLMLDGRKTLSVKDIEEVLKTEEKEKLEEFEI